MGWDDGVDFTVKGVFYPLDQFHGGVVIGRCVENDGLIVVAYDEAVARHVAKIIGLEEGSMFKGAPGKLSDDQRFGSVNFFGFEYESF